MSIALLRARLTGQDIERLVKSESADERAAAAHKICRRIGRLELEPEERKAANEILQFMAKDAASLVRRALSVTLKNSPQLPREVALQLARDVDAVAEPVLESSPVFTDEDLIEIVAASGAAKQTAIASRKTIGTDLVRTLVQHGAEAAVARVAGNDGAEFDTACYETTLSRFSGSEMVTNGLINRSQLPSHVTEKLVAAISDEALQRLVKKHALPPQLAVELAEGARERATIDLIDQAGCQKDMRRFVQQLMLNGRLTPSLVLRAVCCGQMTMFEHAMAELASIEHKKAWMLIHDAGPLGLRAIFERTGLPARIFTAVRAAVDVYHEIQLDGGSPDRETFMQTMIQRVLTRHPGMSRDEADYLLDKLDVLGDAEMRARFTTTIDEDAALTSETA